MLLGNYTPGVDIDEDIILVSEEYFVCQSGVEGRDFHSIISDASSESMPLKSYLEGAPDLVFDGMLQKMWDEAAINPRDKAKIFYGIFSIKDAKALALLGAREIQPGYYEGYLISSNAALSEEHKFAFARISKTLVDNIDYNRFEIRVNSGNETYKRYAEFLGFQFEYTMRRAGVLGQDMDIYSKVKED